MLRGLYRQAANHYGRSANAHINFLVISPLKYLKSNAPLSIFDEFLSITGAVKLSAKRSVWDNLFNPRGEGNPELAEVWGSINWKYSRLGP